MADEQHELPGIGVGSAVALIERGHASQSHSVLNGVIELAIRFMLRFSRAHVRRLWIQILPEQRVPTAIIRVTNRTVVCEVLHSGAEVLR